MHAFRAVALACSLIVVASFAGTAGSVRRHKGGVAPRAEELPDKASFAIQKAGLPASVAPLPGWDQIIRDYVAGRRVLLATLTRAPITSTTYG